MSKSFRQKIDQLGIITSGLCALHCAAIPLLISFGLLGGISGVLHDRLEFVVIISSGCLALFSIYNGLSGHGKLAPQLLVGCGALIIIIGLLSTGIGHAIMAFGGGVLVLGHWLNWRQLSFTD